MKTIVRKVSLEQFKNRFAKQTSASGLADDIILENNRLVPEEIYDNLPVVKAGVSNGAEDGLIRFRNNEERYYDDISKGAMERVVLRYRTMMNILTYINDFFRSSRIFQFCARGTGRKMVEIPIEDFLESPSEFIFSTTVPYVKGACLETVRDDSGNTYYNESPECENWTVSGFAVSFSGKVRYNDNTNNRNIVNGICVGDYFWVNGNFADFISYFKLDTDNGNLPALNRAKSFIQFAEYRKKATSGMEGFIPIIFYIESENEDMGIFTSVVSDWVPGRKYIVGDKVNDSDGIVWTLKKGYAVLEVPVPTTLSEFIEERISDPDDDIYKAYRSDAAVLQNPDIIYVKTDGNEKYFVKGYYDVNPPAEGSEYWEKENDSSLISGITGITESKLSNYKNADVDDNGEQMPFSLLYNNSGELKQGGTINGEIFYETAVPYICSSSRTDEEITFYYIDKGDGQNAVEYTEVYPYRETYGYFDVTMESEPSQKLFYYLDIDFSARRLYADRMYADFSATIERTGTESQDVPYFKEESLFGIQDMSISADNVRIERGTSAAYERHSILGEITSLDDLVKYKNGFFEIIDDENR